MGVNHSHRVHLEDLEMLNAVLAPNPVGFPGHGPKPCGAEPRAGSKPVWAAMLKEAGCPWAVVEDTNMADIWVPERRCGVPAGGMGTLSGALESPDVSSSPVSVHSKLHGTRGLLVFFFSLCPTGPLAQLECDLERRWKCAPY